MLLYISATNVDSTLTTRVSFPHDLLHDLSRDSAGDELATGKVAAADFVARQPFVGWRPFSRNSVGSRVKVWERETGLSSPWLR